MSKYIKNNLGLVMLVVYACIIVLGGLALGEVFLFWLPLATILLIGVFDPLNNLSWSVRAFYKKYLKKGLT